MSDAFRLIRQKNGRKEMALELEFRERLLIRILLIAARSATKYADKETREQIDKLIDWLKANNS